MNQELLGQRKEALQYNAEKSFVLNSLCKPLKAYLNVDWFVRATYPLNSYGKAIGHYHLTENLVFLEKYMFSFDHCTTGMSFVDVMRKTPLHSYSYYLFPSTDNYAIVKMLCQEIELVRGLCIYKRYEDRVEGWGFGSKDARDFPTLITSASVLPFHDFIRYFEEEKTLNKISMPFVEYPLSFDMSYCQPDLHKAKDFKNSIFANNFTLNIGGKSIALSKREWECLSGISQGKTYKGVATALSLSPRTVEDYLKKIKEKTGISYKSKLIDYFTENNQSTF
jgi:DNA-binding CsgD family transcriptional regulator